MRNLLLLVLLAITPSVFAQDYCKQIKKEMPDPTSFSYYAPYDTVGVPFVKISRKYSNDPENGFDVFAMSFQFVSNLGAFYDKNPSGQGENDSKKFVVEFDDKTKFEEESVISYDLMNDEQWVVRTVFLSMEGENLKTFSTKKMSKLTLAGVEKKITADTATAYQKYIECLKEVKK